MAQGYIYRAHLLVLLLLALLLLALPPTAYGQSEDGVTIELRLNTKYEQKPSVSSLEFSSDPAADQGSTAIAPGGVLVMREPLSSQGSTYLIRLDADGDGLVEDAGHVLHQDSTIRVEVERTWPSGGAMRLPYLITYTRYTDPEGQEQELFQWRPHYRAEGNFAYGACEALIAALDFDGDGLFDASDFKRGTTLNLDVDGDGRIWGKKEWLTGDQIIEYCGAHFQVLALGLDGSFVELAPSELPVPVIGEPIPAFTLRTMDGEALSSDSLQGTSYLLDFWASWCSPCVGKFPFLQQLERELGGAVRIIAINVDEASDLDSARKVIEEYGLAWPHVMNGLGPSDPLWRMFGSMEGNRLSIPLYVLVDERGRVRYAGSGGPELEELEEEVTAMLE